MSGYFTFGTWLIVLGLFGAASLVIARRPDAKHIIETIAPYQGWFGAASVVYGAWDILITVLNAAEASAGVLWLAWWMLQLVAGVLEIALGLLLGIGLRKTFAKDDAATVVKLAPYQGALGILSIGVGIAYTILTILH